MPCTHAARPNARHRRTRKLANRSPIRRSIIVGYGVVAATVGVVVVGVVTATVGVVGVVVTAAGSVVVVLVAVDSAAAGAPALISPDASRLAAIAASFGLEFR